MGFFSWKTSDTEKSIPNIFSNKSIFTVFLKTEDGRVWVESAYDGYGVFGGQDIFELIAELNNLEGETKDAKRSAAINLVYKDNPSGSFNIAAGYGIKLPKLFEHKESDFHRYFYPEDCEYQGCFYPRECEY